jgi:hypothetical protein
MTMIALYYFHISPSISKGLMPVGDNRQEQNYFTGRKAERIIFRDLKSKEKAATMDKEDCASMFSALPAEEAVRGTR